MFPSPSRRRLYANVNISGSGVANRTGGREARSGSSPLVLDQAAQLPHQLDRLPCDGRLAEVGGHPDDFVQAPYRLFHHVLPLGRPEQA